MLATTGEAGVIRKTELWGGLFWLLLGLAVARAGLDLGLGRLNEPGSGLVLFWIGAGMCGLAAIVLLSAFRHGGEDLASLWSGKRWGKLLLVCALMLAYALLFERVGFIVLSLALLLVLMFLVDPVKWWIAVPVSLLVVLGVWAALTKWLGIQLPGGVLAGIVN
jgi:putative tricarboxylic transport membrane protein